jgi:hypothetical protein
MSTPDQTAEFSSPKEVADHIKTALTDFPAFSLKLFTARDIANLLLTFEHSEFPSAYVSWRLVVMKKDGGLIYRARPLLQDLEREEAIAIDRHNATKSKNDLITTLIDALGSFTVV